MVSHTNITIRINPLTAQQYFIFPRHRKSGYFCFGSTFYNSFRSWTSLHFYTHIFLTTIYSQRGWYRALWGQSHDFHIILVSFPTKNLLEKTVSNQFNVSCFFVFLQHLSFVCGWTCLLTAINVFSKHDYFLYCRSKYL